MQIPRAQRRWSALMAMNARPTAPTTLPNIMPRISPVQNMPALLPLRRLHVDRHLPVRRQTGDQRRARLRCTTGRQRLSVALGHDHNARRIDAAGDEHLGYSLGTRQRAPVYAFTTANAIGMANRSEEHTSELQSLMRN